ncbi:hypothetical protein PCP53_32345 (plasmid) [Pseudomonas aeruginosa]
MIDEAQRVFGNDGTRARPEKVTRFETHRHQGLDIHLITQHPSLLCTPVRKLVGKHINFIRPYGREKASSGMSKSPASTTRSGAATSSRRRKRKSRWIRRISASTSRRRCIRTNRSRPAT